MNYTVIALQQIKSEFESMSISNQIEDNEPRDMDFDNVNDQNNL